MSPVVVSITRISIATYASDFFPPIETPPKLKPPPLWPVFDSNDVTVPVTRYCAPVSLPICAASLSLARPDAIRFCSSITLCSFSRSTTLNEPVLDSSLLSNPARSRPTPPLHQPALVSFLNSATATIGRPPEDSPADARIGVAPATRKNRLAINWRLRIDVLRYG